MAGISRTIVLRPYPTDYVYLHFHPQRPDEIVYVGRGSGGRAWSCDDRSTAHQVWMLEWQSLGYSPDQFVKIVARGLTPQQAEKREKQEIAFWKAKGLLLNLQLNKGNVRPHSNRYFPGGPKRATKGKTKR
jgi:hypothetical protein